MGVLVPILVLFGAIGFLIGVVVIVHPMSALGLSQRRDGVLTVIASCLVLILAGLLSETGSQVSTLPKQTIAAKTSPSTEGQGTYSKADALKNLTISGFSWRKDGFGSIMKATFVIYNRNKFAVKDPVITCVHSARSGTKVDSNTRTVYEIINAGGYLSVVEMNMGFIHSAVDSSKCSVTDVLRA